MKKITKESFDKLRELYPMLSKNELIKVLGGATSVDCVIKCFDWLDSCHTNDDYKSLLNSGFGYTLDGNGGVNNSDIVSLGNMGSLDVSEYIGSFSMSRRGKIDGKNVILRIPGDGGRDHTVVATGITNDGEIIYWDPVRSETDVINKSKIMSLYVVSKKSCDTGESSGSSSSSGGSSSSSSSGDSSSSSSTSTSSTDYTYSTSSSSSGDDGDLVYFDMSDTDDNNSSSGDYNCCGNTSSSNEDNNYPYNCG